tara:strand:- start:648 stop:1127 length:480 start_codon:yes stop_codon:yes gene_type:complete
MRNLVFSLVFIALLTSFSQLAEAKKRNYLWHFFPKHWQTMDFDPYLGHQQIRQRSLWDGDDWTPEAWIKDAGDERRIMRDLYQSHIILDQHKDSQNIPVLVVGDPFKKLSDMDARRVLKFIDYVFEITTSEKDGMFYVYHIDDSKNPMGLYNKYGFQDR